MVVALGDGSVIAAVLKLLFTDKHISTTVSITLVITATVITIFIIVTVAMLMMEVVTTVEMTLMTIIMTIIILTVKIMTILMMMRQVACLLVVCKGASICWTAARLLQMRAEVL